MSHTKRQEASTTPFEPPRRRLRASPQSGDPQPYAIHHSVSARLEKAHLPHHCNLLRQMARENDIACHGAIHLPELPQTSGRGAADTRFVPHALAKAAGIVAASTAAVGGARARARSCRRAPEVRRASAPPSSPLVEHVDVALLLFSAPRPLLVVEASSIIPRVTRGERLALLLAHHSLESAAADFAAEAAAAALERAAVFLLQWRCA